VEAPLPARRFEIRRVEDAGGGEVDHLLQHWPGLVRPQQTFLTRHHVTRWARSDTPAVAVLRSAGWAEANRGVAWGSCAADSPTSRGDAADRGAGNGA